MFFKVRLNHDGRPWHGIEDGAPPDLVGDFKHEEVHNIGNLQQHLVHPLLTGHTIFVC